MPVYYRKVVQQGSQICLFVSERPDNSSDCCISRLPRCGSRFFREHSSCLLLARRAATRSSARGAALIDHLNAEGKAIRSARDREHTNQDRTKPPAFRTMGIRSTQCIPLCDIVGVAGKTELGCLQKIHTSRTVLEYG